MWPVIYTFQDEENELLTRSVRQNFFFHIVNRPSELRRGRGGVKNCRSGPKIFWCFLGTTEPNWFN